MKRKQNWKWKKNNWIDGPRISSKDIKIQDDVDGGYYAFRSIFIDILFAYDTTHVSDDKYVKNLMI